MGILEGCIAQVLWSPALGLVITHVEGSPDSAHTAVGILVTLFLGLAALTWSPNLSG